MPRTVWISPTAPIQQLRQQLQQQLRQQRQLLRERHTHDLAMDDQRIRFDHLAARDRAVSRGEPDCRFCH